MARITRRQLLGRALTVVGAGALVACESEAALICDDTTGLGPNQMQMRRSTQYTDVSARDGRACHGCLYFEPVSSEVCGTCTLVPGPISPEGHCTLWSSA